MTIDTQLIAQVQQLACEGCTHRVRTLIACCVGFIGLLQSHPELKGRALKVENTLRTFCATGILPLPGGTVKPGATESHELSAKWRIRKKDSVSG